MMKPRAVFGACFLLCLLSATRLLAAENHPIVNGVDSSKWRGFNLLEKFTVGGDARYREEDFLNMRDLGFTFVRLPIDYRCYVSASDWLAFNEKKLREIDEAVELGRKYGIHVCLALHRAPGFCINPPKEPRDLWTDPAAQAAFIAHWKMFAARYRDVPAAALSFNLVNEPYGSTEERYLDVFKRTIAAIRAIDGKRIVMVDGMAGGVKPLPGLLGLPGIIQATRGYHPFTVSHYRAEWVAGADSLLPPEWPPIPTVSAFLYGPEKSEYRSSLSISGDFPKGTKLSVAVDTVSSRSRLVAKADGRIVLDRLFLPGPGSGEWKESEYRAEWDIYQARYEKRYSCSLGAAAKALSLSNDEGDWLSMSGVSIEWPDGRRCDIPVNPEWGRRQAPVTLGRDGKIQRPAGYRAQAELEAFLAPWDALMDSGGTVFIGESGAYNKTPQGVVLAWYRDWLDLWKERRLGWALWNFRGSFGVMDSQRADVVYERYRGRELDREFMDLLREYEGE